MSTAEGGRVLIPYLGVPLPELCTLRAQFGISCPGCGMTRTFIHLAHGRWQDALTMNPVGIIVFLFVCAQIPLGIYRLVLGPDNSVSILWARVNEWSMIVLPALAFIQWPFKLYFSS